MTSYFRGPTRLQCSSFFELPDIVHCRLHPTNTAIGLGAGRSTVISLSFANRLTWCCIPRDGSPLPLRRASELGTGWSPESKQHILNAKRWRAAADPDLPTSSRVRQAPQSGYSDRFRVTAPPPQKDPSHASMAASRSPLSSLFYDPFSRLNFLAVPH